MKTTKVKFRNDINDVFQQQLKENFDNYFKQKNNCNKANGAMIFKLIFVLFLFVATYCLLLSNWFTQIQLLFLTLLFGFSKALIAFNISHDASHNALFENKKWNEVFSYTFNLIGVNRYIWNIKHNASHHAFTNVPGYDMDIEQIKIARLVKHVPLKWYYRFQHIYVPLMYPFVSLFMVFIKDFQMFATKKYGNNTYVNHPRKEYIILIISKLFYFAYAIIIPFFIIKIVWWKFLIGFLLMHMTLGVFLAIILFPVHALEQSPFPEPDENGYVNNSWLLHEIETSTNFGAESKLLNWISGGLNTHIVHHVFPNICHIHYFELTKILKQIARTNNIIIKENTLWQAISSHVRFLKQMGREEERKTLSISNETLLTE